MILDKLTNSERYNVVHPLFEKAFDFLKRSDLDTLPEGKNEIEGDKLFAMVVKGKGRKKEEAKLETHKKYIDIQYSIKGVDILGWRDAAECNLVKDVYDEEKDLAFFNDEVETWFEAHPGTFSIYFPEDAHAPMATETELHKVVVKVLL